jgi:hypothetical protein
MNATRSLVVEIEGADSSVFDNFLQDLSAQSPIRVLPLDTREPSTASAFLLELTAGTVLELAKKLIAHFKGKALVIRIKKANGKELVVSCNDESFRPGTLSSVITEFLDDTRDVE